MIMRWVACSQFHSHCLIGFDGEVLRLHTAFVKLRQADHATSMTHPRRLAQKLKRNACKDRHDQKQCHTERQDEKETICNFICCSRREDFKRGFIRCDAPHAVCSAIFLG